MMDWNSFNSLQRRMDGRLVMPATIWSNANLDVITWSVYAAPNFAIFAEFNGRTVVVLNLKRRPGRSVIMLSTPSTYSFQKG
ncbi:hypothetical protein FSPOR_1156 [Fusarium sporotrichioides]|uniref:Uncharacterized protein n=1 Tax=Fusarium sporotrichioides TaxID=5514 RepID=A0A395SR49_FUSSP|nr:hypothetical protein FSPOR_1156 [Fusarium sporotrichioides]